MPWRQDFKGLAYRQEGERKKSLGLVLFVWPFGIKKRRREMQAKKKGNVRRVSKGERESLALVFFSSSFG